MNIIIAGCGKVGQKILELLSQENDINITAIDIKSRVIRDVVNEYDVMGIIGNAATIDTLNEAGIKSCDMLIAVSESDELNLLICLIAKKLGNCETIARIRKPEYAKEIDLLKDDLSLTMIINPEFTAAREIARSLRFPSAIQIDTFSKGRIEILKFKVEAKSALHEMRIANVNNTFGTDVLICGVEREEDAFIPNGDFILKEGDLVSIVASPHKGQEFFKKIGVKTNKVKDTIIIGGGDTGFYLANLLVQSGISVKIIEKNPERCEKLCQLIPKANIINGDGTDNKLLLEEGIEYSDSVVSLMNIDEENILLTLFAKSISNGKLVTKINRIAFDKVIRNLDLGTIIYPKNIAAEYIVNYVRAKRNTIGSNVETMHKILNGKAEALEFIIKENSPVLNLTLEKMNLKKNVIVACANRNGKVIIPRGKDEIMIGDRVIIVTTHSGFNDIEDILE
ncbi:MAG: Trk system potassium transporter TrkA [Clostridia bacterium]|nr:Trk system potassium transporter TrkA [Clostridia bacterium]